MNTKFKCNMKDLYETFYWEAEENRISGYSDEQQDIEKRYSERNAKWAIAMELKKETGSEDQEEIEKHYKAFMKERRISWTEALRDMPDEMIYILLESYSGREFEKGISRLPEDFDHFEGFISLMETFCADTAAFLPLMPAAGTAVWDSMLRSGITEKPEWLSLLAA